MLVAAVAITPIGGWGVAPALLDPVAIAAGVGVGIASSVIPYVCDQLAMARLSRATYSLMVSLLPATATVIGILVLAQIPSPSEVLGSRAGRRAVAVQRERRRSPPGEAASSRRGEAREPRRAEAAGSPCASDPTAQPRRRCSASASSDRRRLVLCNEEQRAIAAALAAAAVARRARPGRRVPDPTRDGEEPPAFVAAAMAEATAIFAPTTFSISHTRARMEATGRGARIATMPGITQEIFRRALPGRLRRTQASRRANRRRAERCLELPRDLTGRHRLVLSLEGRIGDLRRRQPPSRSGLGEPPRRRGLHRADRDSGEGTIVFDGALAGYGLLASRSASRSRAAARSRPTARPRSGCSTRSTPAARPAG